MPQPFNHAFKLGFILISILVSHNLVSYGQKAISGQSSNQTFTYTPVYERDLPPNLYVDLNFIDDNNNGIVECNENALIKIKITNKGVGKAQGVKLKIEDSYQDRDFVIETVPEIYFIQPQKAMEIEIPIKIGPHLKTAEHKLELLITEHFGYDIDPVYLVLNTLEYQPPKLIFAGLEVIDNGEGTSAIIADGQLQAGELAQLSIFIQNIGLSEAQNVQYTLYSNDSNIYMEDNTGKLRNFTIGEVQQLLIPISPNKRLKYTDELPIYLTITTQDSSANITNFQLPLFLNKPPKADQTLAVKADYNKFENLVARFESTSNKFTTNIGAIKNIDEIEPSKTKRTNAVAVIFGISNYTNLPPAPYADRDGQIMKKYFSDLLGIENVVIYQNGDASGFVFDDVFNPDYGGLQKSIVKGETELFVFYSGHGIPSKDGSKIYLFPADGKVERLENQGYDINNLYTNLDKLGAKNVTVFIDACFSGASRTTEKVKTENLVATKGIKIAPKYEEPWLNNPAFSVFNSSQADETSLGFDPSQSGLFTYYLCLGLQGDADSNNDRKITNEELSQFLMLKVNETSRKIYGSQTPQFHGNKDYVLLEY